MVDRDIETRIAAAGAPRPLTVCVFCGARSGIGPEPAIAARELGTLLGEHGHDLVYGAGGVGLTDEVSRAAYAAGSSVTGVVPRFLYELDRVRQSVGHELVITDDMFERKREMLARSDAFIALPGGYGTIDEILEVVSLGYLGQCPKPMALVDPDGHWAGLVAVLDDIRVRGFTREGHPPLFRVVPSAAAAVAFIEDRGSRIVPHPVFDGQLLVSS